MLSSPLLFASTFFNDPVPIKSAEWCFKQPCHEFFGVTTGPISSSILVFTLSFYGIFVAYKFFQNKKKQNARLYWSISLLLGAVGAMAAGTSFQAFGYEIKCQGKDLCDITSWYEVVYNVLTVWSACFILLGICVAFLHRKKIKPILALCVLYSLAFIVLSILAYQQNYYTILSFEFLLLYISPIYFSVLALVITKYFKSADESTNKYLKSFGILVLTMLGYYIYLELGIGELLWTIGIWFSANDVLHLGMIGWLFYVSNYVLQNVQDKKLEKADE